MKMKILISGLIFILFFWLKAQIFIPFSYWTGANKPIVINQCPSTQAGTLNIRMIYNYADATTCSFTSANAAFTGAGSCSCTAGVCSITGLTLTQTFLASMTAGQSSYIQNAINYTVTRPSGVYGRVQDIIVSTGTWSPRCVGTPVLMWLDATDATTVFQDSAGLTPSTNGTVVARWNDKSGNGFNATQTTAANQPTYSTGVNTGVSFSNNWSSVFNFMNSTLSLNGATGFNGAVGSMFAVVRPTSTGGNSYISVMSFRNAGSNLTGFSTPNATNWGMDWWNNGVYNWNTGAAITTGAFQVIGFTNVTGAQVFSKNGTTYTNTYATTTIPNTAINLMIGNDPCCGNTRYFNGMMAELLAVKLNLSSPASLRQQVEGYLAWKYGLSGSLPAAHPYKNFAP